MIVYIRRNKTSGIKYLGYTTREEIFNENKYLGSGKHWRNHCKKHGGYNKENLELIFSESFNSLDAAKEYLKKFEKKYPNYWLSNEWSNLVPETLEKSPFKDNMDVIFEKHGNPFTGGEIQKKAHKEGKHNYDRSKTAKKGWEKRDRKEAAEVRRYHQTKWIEENPERFLEIQRQNAKKSKEKNCEKLKFRGKVYVGWRELSRETDISTYKLKKYYSNEITIL